MMCRTVFATVCCLLVCVGVRAQTAGVRGRVIDHDTKEPLPFASVYINLTTMGTYTDENGNFTLPLTPGSYELVASFVGYQPYQSHVSIAADEFITLAITLKASTLKAIEVSATRDPAWHKQLARFTKLFLGSGRFASQTKILNPWSLEFGEGKNGMLTA